MEDLIKALQIFLKYGNPPYPTHCEHDALYVLINPSVVTEEDRKKLDVLGFFDNEETECFMSFRFGSA